MRDKNKPASLSEMMGSKQGNGISMATLPDLLGEKMPDLPRNRVGKLRLVHALQNRLGVNFRQFPGVNDLLAEFDKDKDFHEIIQKNTGDSNVT